MSQTRAASWFAYFLAGWWLLTSALPLLSWHLAVPSDLCLAEEVVAKREGGGALPAHTDDPTALCGYCLLALTHPGAALPGLPLLPPTMAVVPLARWVFSTVPPSHFPTPPMRAPPAL